MEIWPKRLMQFVLPALLFTTAGSAQDAQDLAKKLSNPVASLISVPFQFNYDSGYGRTTASACGRALPCCTQGNEERRRPHRLAHYAIKSAR
ncbi:hypothetical protein MesoLjLa_40460 [Mesorhizobium sp. L-2-11]|nr:hypothetical protein MesoLjLa_40460 [Mesorhizobium sp. L-2-11]